MLHVHESPTHQRPSTQLPCTNVDIRSSRCAQGEPPGSHPLTQVGQSVRAFLLPRLPVSSSEPLSLLQPLPFPLRFSICPSPSARACKQQPDDVNIIREVREMMQELKRHPLSMRQWANRTCTPKHARHQIICLAKSGDPAAASLMVDSYCKSGQVHSEVHA